MISLDVRFMLKSRLRWGEDDPKLLKMMLAVNAKNLIRIKIVDLIISKAILQGRKKMNPSEVVPTEKAYTKLIKAMRFC